MPNPKLRTLIMGAAGRDFHNFNVWWKQQGDIEVVCFTATQIPDIDGRVYPAVLAGPDYPNGIPIHSENRLEELIREYDVDLVSFSYSDVPYAYVMRQAARVNAAGAQFVLLGAKQTMLPSTKPVIAIGAVRTGCGKSQTSRRVAEILKGMGLARRGGAPPDALRRPVEADLPALRDGRRHGHAEVHDRGARGVRAAHRDGQPAVRGRRLRADPAQRRGRGRRRPVGRRQQRPAVLPARSQHRGGRPASPRPRTRLLPRRDEPAHGRPGDREQGRHRRGRERGARRGEREGGEPARAASCAPPRR